MRRIIVRIILVMGLAALIAGAVLYLRDQRREAQVERNHSPPAWCSRKPIHRYVGCWVDADLCSAKSGAPCDKVDAYACFSGHGITKDEEIHFCLHSFGDCQGLRDELLRDREYDDVSECAVFRSEQ